ENEGIFCNATKSTNARTDHYTGCTAVIFALRMPASIFESLIRTYVSIENELSNLAELFRFKIGFGVKCPFGSITARNDICNLAREFIDLELGDPTCSTLTG